MHKLLFLATALFAACCEAKMISRNPERDFPHFEQGIHRIRRQLFGGVSSLPGGGFNHQFGARGPIFSTPNHQVTGWGSLSQDRGRTFSSPITYSGGADWTAPRGGLSLSGSRTPGAGSSFNVAGSATIVKTPQHSLGAFASHTRQFDKDFHQLGRGSTNGGLQYNHQNGAGLTLGGTHTPGMPATGSVSGNVPLFKSKDGNTNLDLSGGVNFGGHQKPNSQVGLTLTSKFK